IRPVAGSIPSHWPRGITCRLCGLDGPDPCSGSVRRLRLAPALSPGRADSKPGSWLPSPNLKVGGFLSKVLSTTSPLSSLMAKCRVTSLSGPIRTSVMGVSGLLGIEHVQRQHDGANGNGTVGQVEGWEIPAVLPVN